MVEERLALEAAELGERPAPVDEPAPAAFVQECLHANELGDGALFAALHRGRFVFDATAGEWLAWAGHYWERDLTGKASAAVEAVAVRYLEELRGIVRRLSAGGDEEQAAALAAQAKRLARRIDRLRTVKGRQNCQVMAATLPEAPLVVTGDRLDRSPWLLVCQNRAVDLRTGRSRPGRPEDWTTKAALAEWLGLDAPAPTWERFILEIMAGDQARADYLRRVFGYGITGLTREHVFLTLFGGGRNGKGTLIETLQKVLGPLAGPVPAEMLLDQGRVRNSAGPSPDLMSLRGLRLAFASETERGQRFAASRVKWLSGGDTIIGRNPHDRHQISFPPSHLLILATNWKPKANADDPAFWARMQMVDFPLSFVERPAAPNERPIDRTLEDKLAAEASGILAWLVRGCLEWQEQGLNPPPSVLAATAAWRRSEDDLADFLEERCIVAEGSEISAKAIYAAFKDWFVANVAEKAPSQKRFGEMLGRRFEKDNNGPGKTIRYLGLELREAFG